MYINQENPILSRTAKELHIKKVAQLDVTEMQMADYCASENGRY